ncbi:MAG: hypothetical protein C0459_09905 [Chitinophaga sp.]|jgi:hypothetical protein|nr:hypothetical protein [Chitinophaga sp.]
MKLKLLLLGLVILIISCKKESTTSAAVNQMVDTTIAKLFNTGNFVNGPYGAVSGVAKIYKVNNRYQLALENFNSSNGPDLKVYLSKDNIPSNFINLGSLQSTTGNQLYDIPAGVTPSEYAYVLIHCQQFNHLFGSAILK